MRTTLGAEYVSPSGRSWDLTGDNHVGFCLKAAGIEGLVGTIEEEALRADGVPGEVVSAVRIQPMLGALVGVLRPLPGHTLAETDAMWRADWDHWEDGRLNIHTPSGRWTARCRLPREGIPAPETDMSSEEAVLSLRTPCRLTEGVWWSGAMIGRGEAVVANPGPVTIFPRVRWKGTGKRLTLQSGIVISLPATTDWCTLHLDPHESMAVTRDDGTLDRALWLQLRGTVLPEGVPRRQARTYTLNTTSDLHLMWQVATLNPWR